MDAEEARHDLDAYLNPERYADRGYRAEALDGFRSRSGPDAKMGERTKEAGHVDPAAAARWRQAQTELVGLIREANRAEGGARKELLPASLGDWMATRAAELEQAESGELEIEQPG